MPQAYKIKAWIFCVGNLWMKSVWDEIVLHIFSSLSAWWFCLRAVLCTPHLKDVMEHCIKVSWISFQFSSFLVKLISIHKYCGFLLYSVIAMPLVFWHRSHIFIILFLHLSTPEVTNYCDTLENMFFLLLPVPYFNVNSPGLTSIGPLLWQAKQTLSASACHIGGPIDVNPGELTFDVSLQ